MGNTTTNPRYQAPNIGVPAILNHRGLRFMAAGEGGDGGSGGTGAPAGDSGDGQGGDSGKYTPPATQEELDRIIGARLDRERARYSDYPDLKAKADRVDEVEATAAEKAKEVEAALAGVPAKVTETLRSHLVAVHQISDDDAQLFLTATDPETLLKQAQRLTGRSGERLIVTTEGNPPGNPNPDEERAAVRSLFGGGAA